MAVKEKIKQFFASKAEKASSDISNKILQTPMEKFFVVFLAIISVSALVLGYFQMKKNIYGPAQQADIEQKSIELKQKYSIVKPEDVANQEEIAALQAKDSDLDGLDDYSEIYVYGTSAYMEDTDSDGLLDKEEITNGTNPNCPEGQDCTAETNSTSETNNAADTTDTGAVSNEILNLDNLSQDELVALQTKLLSGEITLADLGINDPEMQKTFDSLRNLNTSQSGSLNTTDQTQAKSELENMTPEQIRTELLARGIDASVLDQVDDETLKNLFLEILKQY